MYLLSNGLDASILKIVCLYVAVASMNCMEAMPLLRVPLHIFMTSYSMKQAVPVIQGILKGNQ